MTNLSVFFQISVSVFCIISSITVLVMLICVILFYRQLSKLSLKLEELIEVAKSTTGEIKDFVDSSIDSLEQFKKNLSTFEFIKNTATKIINNIVNKIKGENDGRQE